MIRGEGDPQIRVDVWLKIAAITFGLWSLAVPLGVAIVRESVGQLAITQAQTKAQLDALTVDAALLKAHVEDLERRQRMDDDQRHSGNR